MGAVLVNECGEFVAQGRNRVLETGSPAPLAGSLLGHAEMTAFVELGVRTAQGMTFYTTVGPCLMCTSTAISMRLPTICSAAGDPVFEGLDEVLSSHSYMDQRMPTREQLDDSELAAFAALLPLSHRVWAKPGSPPRREWIASLRALWEAAVAALPTLTNLRHEGADVEAVIRGIRPLLEQPTETMICRRPSS
ncbi:MAG: hypothetical protein M0Z46_09980 [Actinomycetota bacterium]|nr:hypothetical protein [Actinomycetota bacterium]